MSGPAVIFDKVSLVLGGVRVLDDVSFEVDAGALHFLVGPNGGGKTSLVRSLLGQMPHSGQIRLRGEAAGPVGYVPQSLEFDRNVPMTVDDVMALVGQRRPAFFGGSKRQRAASAAALQRTGIPDIGRRPFGALSGGERQRVLLAQALTPLPQLLVLDEPTAGIDEAGVCLVEEVVCDLSAAGTTIIWINHDLDQVARLAHSVTAIQRRVMFHGGAMDAAAWTASRSRGGA